VTPSSAWQAAGSISNASAWCAQFSDARGITAASTFNGQ